MLVCKVPTRKWPQHVTSIEEQGIVTDDGPAIEARAHQSSDGSSDDDVEKDPKKQETNKVQTSME